MLKSDGLRAPTVGRSTGQGHDIGFIFILSGTLVLILAAVTGRVKIIRSLE
jgi:hypothetical protein